MTTDLAPVPEESPETPPASLVWISADTPPEDEKVVLVWAEERPDVPEELSKLFDRDAHACAVLMARYAPSATNDMLHDLMPRDRPLVRTWVLAPDRIEFKEGVVRWWARFNPPRGLRPA